MSTRIVKICMSDDDVGAWLYERVSALLMESSDMGAIEKALQLASREPCRKTLERLVQEKANQQALVCPKCHAPLQKESYERSRKVKTAFGIIRFS